MPIYAALGKLTPEGARDLKGSAARYEENKRAFERAGAKILAGYALLGPYDFLFLIEAPDEKTAMKLSLITASRGTSSYQTLPALPIEDFFKIAAEV